MGSGGASHPVVDNIFRRKLSKGKSISVYICLYLLCLMYNRLITMFWIFYAKRCFLPIYCHLYFRINGKNNRNARHRSYCYCGNGERWPRNKIPV